MSTRNSDRNLLLGIVALQMDFITRDALIEAMNQWTLAKSQTLSEILAARGELEPADRIVLEQMVDRHVARHGGDPHQSLSAIDMSSNARSMLALIQDPDIRESLSTLTGFEMKSGLGASANETLDWLRKEQLPGHAGRFRIVDLIDEGGLGKVYLARDAELNRDVALKQMRVEIAGHLQSRARFVFEAEITGNLEHPGVVPVYGKGEYDDGRPYYAMQFVRGENLKLAADRFHDDPSLAADSAARNAELQKLLRRFLAVCETMAYAHSRGVIHRDLKPKNVLLGPFGETLVVDWGLAKVIGRAEAPSPAEATLRPAASSEVEPTSAGTRLGTVAYMSPEQARGEVDSLGAASDIYGLGATLYYVLTGRPPIDGNDRVELLLKVERGAIPPVREVKPSVDRALEAICRKAMALKPSDRYTSAKALAEDLERWLLDQPVNAYPDPISRRAARWVRRNKQLAGSICALLLLAMCGVGYHDWRISRAEMKARDFLKVTLVSVGEMLEVCGVDLAVVPNTEKIRDKFAHMGLAVCEKVADNFPDDPGVQFQTAQVYRVIGGIERITEQIDGSTRAYDRAIGILSQLCESNPDDIEARSWLVEDVIDRGSLFFMNGSTGRAERDFELALTHAEKLSSAIAHETRQRCTGMAHINLADVYILKGQPTKAVAAATRAVDLLGPLAESPVATPRRDTDRWLFSPALSNRAAAHERSGKKPPRNPTSTALKRSRKDILIENAEYLDARFQLASIASLRGKWLAEGPWDLPVALRSCDTAIEILKAFVEQSPTVPFYREQLATTLTIRARARHRIGPSRSNDALADCEAALELAQALLQAAPKEARGNPHYLSLAANAHHVKSLVYHLRGDKDDSRKSLVAAQDDLKRSLEIDDSRAADKELLEEIEKQLDKSRPE